jgi:hypothetical protein
MIGGITLKPSAALERNQSSMVSATYSGVPVTARWPRALAKRLSNCRSVSHSPSVRST